MRQRHVHYGTGEPMRTDAIFDMRVEQKRVDMRGSRCWAWRLASSESSRRGGEKSVPARLYLPARQAVKKILKRLFKPLAMPIWNHNDIGHNYLTHGRKKHVRTRVPKHMREHARLEVPRRRCTRPRCRARA